MIVIEPCRDWKLLSTCSTRINAMLLSSSAPGPGPVLA
jgi:hypothetical protein